MPQSVKISDSTLNGQTTTGCLNNTTAIGCSTAAMAAYDPQQWGKAIADLLPGGNGSVNCNTLVSTPIACIIAVNWNENRLALNQTIKSDGTQTYTMMVEP